MEFLKKLDLTGMQFVKILGIVLIGLVLLSIVLASFNSARDSGSFGLQSPGMMPDSYKGNSLGAPTLSQRNVAETSVPPIDSGYTVGDQSEAFEVTEYAANIETRNLDRDCGTVRALKARADVIFENANEYTRGCTYTFKVKKGSVEEILDILKDLNPHDMSENVYTIKREVDDYTSETQILENKLASLDKTLADATASYENITLLATNRGDVESLAKIIESKLTIIERLTSARIEASNQLERINRAKADALDRLEYTYFSVNVYESTYTDWKEVRDSWKMAVQQFVRETNKLMQDISIGLASLVLTIVKFGLYFVVLIFVARFGWAFVKKVWAE